jgi:hypothetical protein
MNSEIKHDVPIIVAKDSRYLDLTRKRMSFDDTPNNPVKPIDDIAGHAGELRQTKGNPILISQDLWKFNPKDYSARWGTLANNKYNFLL